MDQPQDEDALTYMKAALSIQKFILGNSGNHPLINDKLRNKLDNLASAANNFISTSFLGVKLMKIGMTDQEVE